MHVLDQIVQELSDGYWHKVSEIAEKVDLKDKKLGAALTFLRDYGFINWSKGCIKLSDIMRELLNCGVDA